MKLDPRLLGLLLAIDEHGTFIRAAEAEGISQPALTNKVTLLERQIGTRLIDRGRHGARLNEYGRLLIRHARAMGAVVARAEEEVALSLDGLSGPLIVGGTPISIVELMPRALASMDGANSKIRVTLIEADDDILLDRLCSGEIELMLGGMLSGLRDDSIQEEPLIDFPLRAVVGRQNPLWQRRQVALTELVDQEWALPAVGSGIRNYVDAIFATSGQAAPANYWSCSSMHGLKSLVQHSTRISVMPAHAISLEAEQGTLKGLIISGPSISRQLNILHLRHLPLSPTAKLFAEHLRATAKEIAGSSSSFAASPSAR